MTTPLPLEIDPSSVKQMLDAGEKFLLLDCREPDEHALVHIAGSVLIPMSQLAARAAELATYRDQRIVVHCHLGGRSLRVANWLRAQGFSHSQNLTGGIDAWSVEIDPRLPRY